MRRFGTLQADKASLVLRLQDLHSRLIDANCQVQSLFGCCPCIISVHGQRMCMCETARPLVCVCTAFGSYESYSIE